MAAMNITGEQIKEARERMHMTQTDLAEKLDVSLRTIGSWERGESVPRSRMGAIRQVLKMEQPEDNREALGRLIQEELETSGRGPTAVTEGWSLAARRSFYTWRDGMVVPATRSRAMLEDALGWRRGVVTEVINAPITREFTLSEVRDWAAQGVPAVVRAKDLTTDELVTELSRRFWVLQSEVDTLREAAAASEPSNVVPLRDSQDMYDVAANNTDPGRNMEHLEDEVER